MFLVTFTTSYIAATRIASAAIAFIKTFFSGIFHNNSMIHFVPSGAMEATCLLEQPKDNSDKDVAQTTAI